MIEINLYLELTYLDDDELIYVNYILVCLIKRGFILGMLTIILFHNTK